MKYLNIAVALCGLTLASGSTQAEDIACFSTTFRLIGPNDKVCVSAFDDPKVPGITCHQPSPHGWPQGDIRTGRRSVAILHRVPPAESDQRRHLQTGRRRKGLLREYFAVFQTYPCVPRCQQARNTLVYVAISDRLIEGSPQNSISTVPIMPWAGR